jgi:hypothetical protein
MNPLYVFIWLLGVAPACWPIAKIYDREDVTDEGVALIALLWPIFAFCKLAYLLIELLGLVARRDPSSRAGQRPEVGSGRRPLFGTLSHDD